MTTMLLVILISPIFGIGLLTFIAPLGLVDRHILLRAMTLG
jgi:hypothetical protein